MQLGLWVLSSGDRSELEYRLVILRLSPEKSVVRTGPGTHCRVPGTEEAARGGLAETQEGSPDTVMFGCQGKRVKYSRKESSAGRGGGGGGQIR